MLTVEGHYKDGKINLTEPPLGVQEARVLVTFLPAVPAQGPSGMITYGMFIGGRPTTEEDFAAAEWRGPKEDAGGK